MADVIIKYALGRTTGESVFIDNASNGISCNCVCANCGKIMIAVQGEQRKREWHFRHHEETNCTGGQETAIHKFAKQIIVENNQIAIPNEVLIYSQARQEESFLSIIPDVVVVSNNCNVFFEVTVTHGIDAFKRGVYLNGQHKSIEIDLREIAYDISPDELKKMVLHQINNKRKIYWQSEEKKKEEEIPLLVKIGFFFLGFLLLKSLFTKKNRYK